MRNILASLAIAAVLSPAAGVTMTANDLFLGDDDYALVPLDFEFTFYGVAYNEIYVGSNGFITFTDGNSEWDENLLEFLEDEPRIAAFWDDLDPEQGGTVVAKCSPNEMIVSFSDVPEHDKGGSNTFSMTLFANGNIEFYYDFMTSSDALVGLSPGGNLGIGTAVDFSTSSAWDHPTCDKAIYEIFTGLSPGGAFDLVGLTISFIPAPEGCTADLDGDGVVNTADLLILFANWGPCP